VTGAVIREAIANGAQSVAELGEMTKAGTGCGSCKVELAQLLDAPAPREKNVVSLPLVAAG
jgi:assimilatory nitrate reductase catalytic subunit